MTMRASFSVLLLLLLAATLGEAHAHLRVHPAPCAMQLLECGGGYECGDSFVRCIEGLRKEQRRALRQEPEEPAPTTPDVPHEPVPHEPAPPGDRTPAPDNGGGPVHVPMPPGDPTPPRGPPGASPFVAPPAPRAFRADC